MSDFFFYEGDVILLNDMNLLKPSSRNPRRHRPTPIEYVVIWLRELSDYFIILIKMF